MLFAWIRPQKFHYPLFLALGILFAPLEGDSSLFPFVLSVMAKPPVSVQPPNLLKDTVWQLVDWDDPAFLPKDEIILRFTDKDLSGSTGCNRYQGGYQLKGTQLQVGTIATTRMACHPDLMQQEMAYLKALETIQNYSLNAQGKLEIRYGNPGASQRLQFAKVETTAAGLNPSSTPPPMDLEGTSWRLIRLGSSQPRPQRPATLSFKNKTIAGTAGCNRFSGSFTTAGDRLSISSQIASTMMACPQPWMEQEAKVLEALKMATIYRVNEQGQLLIFSDNDTANPSLTFAPLDTNQSSGS